MDNNMKLLDYGFFFGGRTEVVAVAAPGEEEGGVGARELERAMELLEGPEGVIDRNVKNTRIHTREPFFRFLKNTTASLLGVGEFSRPFWTRLQIQQC